MQSAHRNHGSAGRQLPAPPVYSAAPPQPQAAMSRLMPPLLSQEEMYRFQQYHQQLQYMQQQQQSLWQQQQLSSTFPAQLPFAALTRTAPPAVLPLSAASQQQQPSSSFSSSSSSSHRKKHKHRHRQHETQAQSSSSKRHSRQQQQRAADVALLEPSCWSSSSFHHPYAQPLRQSGAAAEETSMSPSTAFPTLPGMEDVLSPLPSFHADGGYDRSAAQPLLDPAAAEHKAEQQGHLLPQHGDDDSSRNEAAVHHDRTAASESARDVRATGGEQKENGAAAHPSSVVAALREQGKRKHESELMVKDGRLLTAAPSSAVLKPSSVYSLHLALPSSASGSSRAAGYSASSSSFLLTFPFDRLMLEMLYSLTRPAARSPSSASVSSQQPQSQHESELTLDEVGYIASFLAAEFASRSDGRDSSASTAAVQSAMLDLCADVLHDRAADDGAAEQQEEQLQRVVRFLRVFGSTAKTAPLLLSAAMQSLQAFVNTATAHTRAAQTAAAAASPSSSSSCLSFATAHVDALVNSFHLCSLMETLLLVPASASASALSSDCLSAFRRLYSASMDAQLFDVCPLLCAHLWRIACVVAEAEGGGGRRPLLLEAVRRGRKRQWEEEVKGQEAVRRAEEMRGD